MDTTWVANVPVLPAPVETLWVANMPVPGHSFPWSEILSIIALLVSGYTFWWTSRRSARLVCPQPRATGFWRIPNSPGVAFGTTLFIVNEGAKTAHIDHVVAHLVPDDNKDGHWFGAVLDESLDKVLAAYRSDVPFLYNIQQSTVAAPFSIPGGASVRKDIVFHCAHIEEFPSKPFEIRFYAQEIHKEAATGLTKTIIKHLDKMAESEAITLTSPVGPDKIQTSLKARTEK
jgi:hypothetical protein